MSTMKKINYGLHALLLSCMVYAACDKFNYVDDLRSLGGRVEWLETMSLQVNEGVVTLKELIAQVEKNGYITKMEEDQYGNHIITFNNGSKVTIRDGLQGQDGRDGTEATLQLSVKQGSDGYYYWILNGDWLLDKNGERIPASAIDGKDGSDGKTATATVPLTRINPDTRHWEISTDGGETWTDTGSSADGKDGKNGTNGKDGTDGACDLFLRIEEAPDGQSITFVLSDGRTFKVPIF